MSEATGVPLVCGVFLEVPAQFQGRAELAALQLLAVGDAVLVEVQLALLDGNAALLVDVHRVIVDVQLGEFVDEEASLGGLACPRFSCP